MKTKPYYISVQSKTIMENQGDAAYELEINATAEDIEKLSSMFEEMGDYDQSTLLEANLYTYPYHLDLENDGYDYYLREVYEFLYELGTPETKRHIENAGLLHLEPNNG